MNSNESKIIRICGFGIYKNEQVEADIEEGIWEEMRNAKTELYKNDKFKFSNEIDKILTDKKITILLKEDTPFVFYKKDSAKFVISYIWYGEIYLTLGIITLFQKAIANSSSDRDREKKKNILKGIIECCSALLINVKQAEYLAEEVYLIYKKSTGSLEDGVLSLFKNTAERILKEANKNNCEQETKTTEVLEEIIGKVKCAKNRCNKKRILKYLLECDLNDNEKQRFKEQCLCVENINDIEIKNKSLRYKDIMFLHKCGTLYVIGDTHGDSWSTEYIIKNIEKSLKKDDFVVFLGDFVNNGLRSIENLITVLEFKNKHRDKNNVILLSGNHEFRETYLTVLKEYFETHWNNSILHPFPFRLPSTHYGHIRLELITMFGVEEGEEIYELFERWGRSLPYIAFSQKGIMMSHSIGLPTEVTPSLKNLADAKLDENDIEKFDKLGYEAWKKDANTIHSKMVNEKDGINPDLLKKFKPLGVNVFVVGNTHYRSGDIHIKGKMNKEDEEHYEDHYNWDISSPGIFATTCSSWKESPYAGHYMYQEMVVESFGNKGDDKEGNRYKEGRTGEAKPCYIKFECNTVTQITKENNLVLVC